MFFLKKKFCGFFRKKFANFQEFKFFDVYWIQTNRHPDRQAKIHRLYKGRLQKIVNIFLFIFLLRRNGAV